MEPQPLGLRSYYLFNYLLQTTEPSPQPYGVNLSQQNREKRSCKSKKERKERVEKDGRWNEAQSGCERWSCGARVGPVSPEPARQTRWADAAFGAKQAPVPKGQIEIMFLIEVMCKKIAWLRLS